MVYLLLASVGLAIVVGTARGGRLGQLGRLTIWLWWLIPLTAIAQSVLLRLPHPESRLAWWHPRPLAMVVSYVVLWAVVWLNRQLPGMRIALAGIALNLLVIATNGGYMPITPEAWTLVSGSDAVNQWSPGAVVKGSKDVVLPSQQTLFWILGDALVIPDPFPWPTAMSIGDVLIAVGVFIFIVRAMQPPSESEWDTHESDTTVRHDRGEEPRDGTI